MASINNGFWAKKLLNDGGRYLTKQMLLQKAISGTIKTINEFLAEINVKQTIEKLKSRNIIVASQYDLIYPPNGIPTNLGDWDIPLVILILNNCLTLSAAENIAIQEIHELTNTIFVHRAKVEMTDTEFQQNWPNISSTLTKHSKLLINPSGTKHIQDLITDIYAETLTADRTMSYPETQVVDDSLEFDSIDQRYVAAYLDALKEGEETTNTIRVNIVGNVGVGKSTLTRNLLGMDIDPNIESTDGIDVHVYNCCDNGDWSPKVVKSNDDRTAERIALSSVDLQSKIQKDIPVTTKKQTDSDKSKSVRNISNIENITIDEHSIPQNMQFAGQSGIEQSLPLMIDETTSEKQIDNPEVKKDVLSDGKEKELVHKFALKLREKVPTSEKVIQIWDFGGQFIYYATHQLFHSRRAVYLLVLNASNELNNIVEKCEFTYCSDKDVQYFCRFWMHSINSFVGNGKHEPPVILVATHTDTKPGWNHEKQAEFFGSVRNLFDDTTVGYHIQPESFAINNFSKDSSDVENLRKYIVEVAKSQDSWNSTVPTRWIPLEDSLSMRKSEKYITLNEVNAIGAELKVPITDEVQIKSFLMYHHALGNLIYFDDEGLSEFVILDPQWIIDAFKAIITANAYCQKRGPLRKMWKQLTKEAILSDELLKEVWSLNKSDNQYWSHKDLLLKCLTKLGIISAVTEIDVDKKIEQHKDYFLVPSLLSAKDLCMEQLFESRIGTQTTLVFAFEDNFVPPVLHHRLTAAALGKWKVLVFRDQRMLAESVGVYLLDENHAGVIEVCDTSIEIRVVNLCGEGISSTPTDELRRFVRFKIDAEFRRFSGNDSQYTLGIRCNFNNKKGKQIMALSEIEISKYDKISCPDIHLDHNIGKADIRSQWFSFDIKNSTDENKTMKTLREDSKRNLLLRVTDKELSKVAYALGFEWELLGIELGISISTIEQIKMDNPSSTRTQIFKMLRTWAESKAEKASMENLLASLVCVVGMTVDWDTIRNMLGDN